MENEKPTVKELCEKLNKLVKWSEFAIGLPGIEQHDIDIIQEDNPNVGRRKQTLYDTWLRRCPYATWDHVEEALKKAGEVDLAKEISQMLLPQVDDGKKKESKTEVTDSTTGQ